MMVMIKLTDKEIRTAVAAMLVDHVDVPLEQEELEKRLVFNTKQDPETNTITLEVEVAWENDDFGNGPYR